MRLNYDQNTVTHNFLIEIPQHYDNPYHLQEGPPSFADMIGLFELKQGQERFHNVYSICIQRAASTLFLTRGFSVASINLPAREECRR